jgi:hypothetical protein
VTNGDEAAWVQAVAAVTGLVISLIAVGISVCAIRRQGAAERERNKLRARSIAVATYTDLHKVEGLVQNATEARERLAGLMNTSNEVFAEALRRASVPLPPMLARSIDHLYALGEPAGPTCLQLVTTLWQHNEIVEALASMTVKIGRQPMEGYETNLDGHLALLRQVIEKALHDVELILPWRSEQRD